MNEYLEEAKEELKRLEHIIYVSLKYTRTVDILRNGINRLISTCDFLVEAILEDAKEKGHLPSIPPSPALRNRLVPKIYPEDTILLKFITFSMYLRDIIHAKFDRREEYRRHGTMIAKLEDSTSETNLVNLEKFGYGFFDYVLEFLEGKPLEDD